MKLIGFKTAKPRQFNYKPVFFDKEQEDFDKRLHKARTAAETSDESELLRTRMHQSWKLKEQQERKRNGKRNLMIALFLIALLIYFIFF